VTSDVFFTSFEAVGSFSTCVTFWHIGAIERCYI